MLNPVAAQTLGVLGRWGVVERWAARRQKGRQKRERKRRREGEEEKRKRDAHTHTHTDHFIFPIWS